MLRFNKQNKKANKQIHTSDPLVIVNYFANHVTDAQKNCIFLWFMFKVGICCKVRYLLFSFYSTWHEEMSLFRLGVIDPLGENWRSSLIRLMLLDCFCKTESSDLVDNLCGMAYTICQEEKSPRRCSGSEHGTAQHRNSHALWFGTLRNRASVFLSF